MAKTGGKPSVTMEGARRLPEALKAHQWKPGQSGNPGGRKKVEPAVRQMLIDSAPTAAQTLCELAADTEVHPRIRLQAATAILDRVYGKAVQPIDASLGSNGEPVVIELKGVLADWAR